MTDILSAIQDDLLSFLPLWTRQLLILIVLGLIGYPLLRLCVRSLIPWLASALVEPLAWMVEMIGRTALLPDFLAARALARLEKPLPVALYSYGDGVAVATKGARNLLRRALPGLQVLRNTPAIVIFALMIVIFAQWNSSHCSASVHGRCVSPVSQWRKNLDTWREDRHTGPDRRESASLPPVFTSSTYQLGVKVTPSS